MPTKKDLLEEHKTILQLLENSDFEKLKNFLKKHFQQEEKFFETSLDENIYSPLQMLKSEHKLLLEYLEDNQIELFKELLRYHLFKEETQIYTLL
jgi:DNA-binding GntR family transcriptional regulator